MATWLGLFPCLLPTSWLMLSGLSLDPDNPGLISLLPPSRTNAAVARHLLDPGDDWEGVRQRPALAPICILMAPGQSVVLAGVVRDPSRAGITWRSQDALG